MYFWGTKHRWLLLPTTLLCLCPGIEADCNTYSPAFPLPFLDPASEQIQQAYAAINSALNQTIDSPMLDTVSLSIEVTSSKQTLFELHHTARAKNADRPGAEVVNGSSRYIIASVTKAFTVLALLELDKAGKLGLNDPINQYVPELNEPQNGTLPWKDITLITLAAQLSGLPRDMGQGDEIVYLPDPVSHGLPALQPSDHHEIQCDSITNFTDPCTRNDLLNRLKNAMPVFAPKQQSTYSNIAYQLLSLALENVTNSSYETLVQDLILDPLNLTSTSFAKPPDSIAVLPKGNSYYWDVDKGVQKASGGLYSSSSDLAKFVRYALSSYNGITPSANWFTPLSYASNLNTFTGMPWEIFRTTSILNYTNRPVTFVTKSGGLPGYNSFIVSIPDYDLGMSILVGGPQGVSAAVASTAVETVGVAMVQAADNIAHTTLQNKYTGAWSASDQSNLNSSFRLSHSRERGLWVESWISNGTDVLDQFAYIRFPGISGTLGQDQYLQAVPTLLYKDAENQQGEIWRLIGHPTNTTSGSSILQNEVCSTDIDQWAYAGLPLNEIVLWDEQDGGNSTFGRVELTGFRVMLERDQDEQGASMSWRRGLTI